MYLKIMFVMLKNLMGPGSSVGRFGGLKCKIDIILQETSSIYSVTLKNIWVMKLNKKNEIKAIHGTTWHEEIIGKETWVEFITIFKQT